MINCIKGFLQVHKNAATKFATIDSSLNPLCYLRQSIYTVELFFRKPNWFSYNTLDHRYFLRYGCGPF